MFLRNTFPFPSVSHFMIKMAKEAKSKISKKSKSKTSSSATTTEVKKSFKELKPREFTEGVNPSGIEREFKKQEIRLFLQKHGNNRSRAIKKFREKGLSYRFILRVIRGTEGDKKWMILNKKILRFLSDKTGGNISGATEDMILEVYSEFQRKGSTEKSIAAVLFKICEDIESMAEKESLMKILKKIAAQNNEKRSAQQST